MALVGVLAVCVGMSMVLIAYICMLWYAELRVQPSPNAAEIDVEAATATGTNHGDKRSVKGLSAAELERLPGLKDGGTVDVGTECAVCLDDIEMGQSARVLPECRHAFHRRCADSWLSNNAVCPLCRAVPLPSS